MSSFVKSKLENQKIRQKLFSISDVANFLGVGAKDLWAEIRMRKTLPAPTHGIPGRQRKYYDEKDVKKILTMVEVG